MRTEYFCSITQKDIHEKRIVEADQKIPSIRGYFLMTKIKFAVDRYH